ncbi:hypothetical protein V8F20_000036 [Naviculisporaceae sp. PSN 640]
MATNNAPRYAPAAIETISPEDFETASIRSAAPSYISDAPSYHSTAPISDPVPPYSPRTEGSSTHGRPPPLVPPPSGFSMVPAPSAEDLSGPRTTGLPPVPSAPLPLPGVPSLGQFRIPTISANPNARHYHRVAHRRATAAGSSSHSDGGILRRALLGQIEEEERNRVRPLEDPYLVGEQAAREARQERLARENGMDILIREDRRWDLFLAQMRDQEEREKSWKRFRRATESARGGRLVQRLGALGAR